LRGSAVTNIWRSQTSCDETGVGIARLDADGSVTLLADEVASSVEEHVRFGGVVPEIASRAHLEALGPAMRRALATADLQRPDIVAATNRTRAGRRLIGGSCCRQGIFSCLGSAVLCSEPSGRALGRRRVRTRTAARVRALLVSGDIPTCCMCVRSASRSSSWAARSTTPRARPTTRLARLLGLGYPGGKVLDDLARTGDPDAIAFPRGMTVRPTTRMRSASLGSRPPSRDTSKSHPDAATADIAAGFQEAVADVLTRKAVRAATDLGVRRC